MRKKDHITVDIRPHQGQWRLELMRVRWDTDAYPIKVEDDLFDTVEEAKEAATVEIERIKKSERMQDDIDKRTVRYQVQL